MSDETPLLRLADDPEADLDLGFEIHEDEARALCQLLLCNEQVPAKSLIDPSLRAEVSRRLAEVGFGLGQVDGRIYAIADAINEGSAGYSDPQLAAIAQLAIELLAAPGPGQARARIGVSEFHASFSRSQGWSKEWLRRAVLGPLERDGYLKVIAPGQRRSAEYIEAGPRLRLLNLSSLSRAFANIQGAPTT